MNTLMDRVMNRTIMNISRRSICCGGNCRSCLLNDPKIQLEIQKNREKRQRRKEEKLRKEKMKKIIEIQSVPYHNHGNDFMRGNLYFN